MPSYGHLWVGYQYFLEPSGHNEQEISLKRVACSTRLTVVLQGKCVVPVFSTMAGLCGMAVGVIAWCHQQLK